MTDFNGTARKIARPVRGCTTDAQYADLLVQIEDALREASDRALKQDAGNAGHPERSEHHNAVRDALEGLLEAFSLGPLGCAAKYGPDVDVREIEAAAVARARAVLDGGKP